MDVTDCHDDCNNILTLCFDWMPVNFNLYTSVAQEVSACGFIIIETEIEC